MCITKTLSALAVLGLALSPAVAADELLSQAPNRFAAALAHSAPAYTLDVAQGAGIDLPTVLAELNGPPSGSFFIMASVDGLDPFLVDLGRLGPDGVRSLHLALPAEMLEQPVVYRAGFVGRRGTQFSDPEPLDLGSSDGCNVEDWEDHDCGTGAGCENGDGDSASAPGQILSAQWEDEWGNVSALNDSPDGPDYAVIFDSANPTGGDDDLSTPTFGEDADGCIVGGPDGGGQGPVFPGNPCQAYDHVVVIQENDDGCDDGFCDVPDDEGWGGVIRIDARFDLGFCSVDLLDVDEAGGAWVRVGQTGIVCGTCDPCEEQCDDEGCDGACDGEAVCCGPVDVVTQEIFVPAAGDNSIQRVFLDENCSEWMEVEFSGSGALAQFEYFFCD